MIELAQQLLIIMVGKQVVNNVTEIILPYVGFNLGFIEQIIVTVILKIILTLGVRKSEFGLNAIYAISSGRVASIRFYLRISL